MFKCGNCGQPVENHSPSCSIGGDVTCSDEVSAVQPVRGLLQEDFPTVHEQLAALKSRCNQLEDALSGMLENYIEMKRIILIAANSDGPWGGSGMTPEDDIHVILARSLLAQPEAKQ